MKNKKIYIIIFTLLIVIFCIILTINRKNTNKNTDTLVNTNYNFETGNYYIINSTTNEVITEVRDKGEIQKYIDNPDYNPNPLLTYSSTLEEKIY